MRSNVSLASGSSVRGLEALPLPVDLDALVPGTGDWEVEIGFGKGRYLLRRAAEDPDRRFLGIEVARKYWRLVADRARRRGLENVLTVRAEAQALLATALPAGFARAVHVYFPDPWPKTKHHRRRLFDPASVDLVLGLLAPGGTLWFATDFLAYGDEVERILAAHPAVALDRLGAWPEGPRTNYEAKYVTEGRPIRRRAARIAAAPVPLHPEGRSDVLCAWRTGEEDAA